MWNSHLQSESWAMTPPSSGPRTKATASVAPIMAPMRLGRWTGPISTSPICVKLYKPEAPMPWSARQIMLPHVSVSMESDGDVGACIQCNHVPGSRAPHGKGHEDDPRQDQHVASSVNITQLRNANGKPYTGSQHVAALLIGSHPQTDPCRSGGMPKQSKERWQSRLVRVIS